MSEKIVLTISVHPLWGPVFQLVIVEKEPSGALTITEIATEMSSEGLQMNESAQKILAFTVNYSDRSLMKNYSKEKTIKAFHSTVTPDTINNYIRPCIEGYHRKIVRLLYSSGIPLYFRDGTKTRNLWPQDRIKVTEKASQIVFTFEKEKDSGLHYSICIEGESGVIDLYSRSCITLSRDPAVIVTDKTLLFFEDIDVKKLTPFFTKKIINVPSSSEDQYLKTFVRNCVLKFKVNATGIDIREIQPEKEARISFEADWYGKPALLLNFYYEKKKYPLDYPDKKIVIVDENEGHTALRWFHLDKEWERGLIKLLLDSGLQQTGPNHFSCIENKDTELSKEFSGMVDWIRMHKDILTAFQFSQDQLDHAYFLGEISMVTNVETGRDWFDLHCTVIFGKFQIPFSRFRNHILENKREYVLPDGSIAILPSEWFDRYYELMLFSKNNGENFRLRKNQYRLAEPIKEFSSDILLPKENQNPPEVPSTLKASLRPYQIAGFQWLVWLYRNGFGGCLADDMGLGKTVQTIALLEYISSERKDQDVSCSSTLQECIPMKKEHNPFFDGQLSLFDDFYDTGYENLECMTEHKVQSEQRSIHDTQTGYLPSLIVMPTSLLYNWQNEIRKFAPNLKFYTYSGTKRLKSKDTSAIFRHYQIVLTTYGTLRNDIELLRICQFHHLILDESQYVKNPDSLTYKAVHQIDALYKIALTGTPVENSLTDLWAQFNLVNENMLGSYNAFRNAYIHPIAHENKEKEAALLHIIQPFLMRRTKQEVTPELPPLQEETVYCDMSPEQKECYQAEKNKLRNSLLDEKMLVQPHQLSMMTLQGLTRLRLLANHPKLVVPDYAGDSGKFEQIIMRFETLRSEGHKVLIFSSFVKHLRILADHFEGEHWPYALLTGSMPAAEREKEIERFTREPEIACFFISLKAGGVGLNLTAADYVFIIDPWWNPAAEMQALSRSHRIGQDKNVIVYRFISSKTIEEKIRLLQNDKARLAATFVTSSNPLANLGREEISRLL